MNWIISSWKNTTKTELILVFIGVGILMFLKIFTDIPKGVINTFFYGFASGTFVFESFFKKAQVSLNHRLYGALLAGFFLHRFLSSISILMAQWVIKR